MKLLLILLTLISTPAFSASKCAIKLKKTNICAKLDWQDQIIFDDYLTMTVSYYKEGIENKFVDPKKEVIVYPWMLMGHHEHGSAPTQSIKMETGVYEISNIYFMSGMSGEWQMRLRYSGSDPKKDYLAKVTIDL